MTLMLWFCVLNASGLVSSGIGYGNPLRCLLHWPHPQLVTKWLLPLEIQTTLLGTTGFLSFSSRVSAIGCPRLLPLPIPLHHRFQLAKVALVLAALILGHYTVLGVRYERQSGYALFLVVSSIWYCSWSPAWLWIALVTCCLVCLMAVSFRCDTVGATLYLLLRERGQPYVSYYRLSLVFSGLPSE